MFIKVYRISCAVYNIHRHVQSYTSKYAVKIYNFINTLLVLLANVNYDYDDTE